MDVHAEPQSLFVVVSQEGDTPYPISIIRLETPLPNHEHASFTDVQVIPTDFSAHIPHLPKLELWDISWVISASSTGDLYILPDWFRYIPGPNMLPDFRFYAPADVGSFPGLIFNLSTKKCKIIKPPLAPKFSGYVVTMGDHIYFITQTRNPSPHFERYDTLSQSWDELKPLPTDQLPFQSFIAGYIRGSAVLDDTILFNVTDDSMTDNTIMAYNVGKNEWYIVKVLNDNCYGILGEAVVLNKIIYIIVRDHRTRHGSVVTLTLKCEETLGDLAFTCHQNKEYKVPGMFEIGSKGDWDASWFDRRLVHLGKDNFCVVQCCKRIEFPGYIGDTQYLLITYIELSEQSTVTNIRLHKFKCGERFMIEHCFSKPKCKTTAIKEGTIFNLNQEAEIVSLPLELLKQCPDKPDKRKIHPLLGGHTSPETNTTPDETQEDVPKKSYASVVAAKSNVPSKSSIISAESFSYGAASGPDEEGNFICLRNLPNDFNSEQLYKGLWKFGPIKTLSINDSHKSELVVNVEFESTTSKQNAIKASSISIGCGWVMIEKRRGTSLDSLVIETRRGTGLTQDDFIEFFSHNNKFKNHGKDSLTKTTSGGHNEGKRKKRDF